MRDLQIKHYIIRKFADKALKRKEYMLSILLIECFIFRVFLLLSAFYPTFLFPHVLQVEARLLALAPKGRRIRALRGIDVRRAAMQVPVLQPRSLYHYHTKH